MFTKGLSSQQIKAVNAIDEDVEIFDEDSVLFPIEKTKYITRKR